jgi:hypothetical protein
MFWKDKIRRARNQPEADSSASCLPLAGYLIGLIFNPEDRSNIFL